MREIKFRGWCMKDKVMHLINPNEESQHGRMLWLLCETGQWIVMQYTGVQDRNGKDIYEGDILNFAPVKGSEVVVTWNDRKAMFMAGNSCMSICPENLCVVGNIYENPELVEKINARN